MLLAGFATGGSLSGTLAFLSYAAFRFMAFHSSLYSPVIAPPCKSCNSLRLRSLLNVCSSADACANELELLPMIFRASAFASLSFWCLARELAMKSVMCTSTPSTDSDIEQGMRGQEEWGRQRKKRTPAVEAGKSAGSPKPPAGSSSSSSSSSVSKQATARQVAAELIRLGDTSLSAPLLSTSGTVDNLLSSQVDRELTGRELGLELEHNALMFGTRLEVGKRKRGRAQICWRCGCR